MILLDQEVRKKIYDFNNSTDLVISGHLHDGYLPKKLDKVFGNTNAGLFLAPFAAPFPGITCRGVHNFGRGYLFISQGFRKWSADVGLFNLFEKITANDIEEIIVKNIDTQVEEKIIKTKFFQHVLTHKKN